MFDDNCTFQGQREPFVALPNWIKGRLHPNSFAVLWLLQSYQPEGHWSVERLAKDSGLTGKRISTILQKLETEGYLRITPSDPQSEAPGRLELLIWEGPANQQEQSA
jgi:hypothetical protein